MPFPTTAILDTFNRANEMPLNQANWRDVTGVRVISNQANIVYESGYYRSFYATPYGPDCDAYVFIPTIDTTVGVPQVFIYARYDIDNQNGYYVDAIYQGGGGADEIRLIRETAGGSTVLGTFNITLANGDGVGLRCVGNAFSIYHYTGGAWALVNTVGDLTYPGAGYTGLRIMPAGGIGPAGIPLEDFGAGNCAGAPFPEPGVVDSFNRPDEGPPPSAAWVDQYVLGVIGNRGALRPLPVFYNSFMLWRAVPTPSQEVYVTVSTRQDDLGLFGVVSCYTDQGNVLEAVILRDDAGGDVIIAGDVVGGVPVGGCGPFAIDYQDGDALGLQKVGSLVRLWYRPVATGVWVEQGSFTATLTGGAIGLWVTDTTTRLADFGGGNWRNPNLPGAESCPNLVEEDLILVPTGSGYQAAPLLQLLGVHAGRLRALENAGLAPLHFITQRGPYQDGESALDMRYDVRVLQVLIAERLADRTTYWDRRWDLLDLLRPNRAFNGGVFAPTIYRKLLPGGKQERGTDGQTTAGDADFISLRGRFVDRGGLVPGARFSLTSGADAGDYVIVAVPNDYTVTLDAPLTATATGVHWRYMRYNAQRDLYCVLEEGPKFNLGPEAPDSAPQGYREALRFVAHDPFWYGPTQTETWLVDAQVGDLVFDGLGAWFGETAGTGRWLFALTYVGAAASIIYWGTVGAKPVITIRGPAVDPQIINNTLGTQIDLAYTVAAGETVIIDTQNLTAVSSLTGNVLPHLTGDLATFALEPDPQAPGRINSVTVNFGGGTGASSARLSWRNRYVGI